MKHRLLTGFTVAGFFLAAFAFGPYWALLLLLVGVHWLAETEFADMVEAGGSELDARGAYVGGLLYLAATALDTPLMRTLHPDWAWTCGGVPLPEAMAWLVPGLLLARAVLRRKPERALERFAITLVAVWYTAVLLSFLLRIGFEWPPAADGRPDYTGRLVLFYCVWVVKLGDVGAFAIGMGFGQKGGWPGRRLIPEVSPKKSVAGLGGAYLGSVLASLAVAWGAQAFGGGKLGSLPLPWGHAVAIGVMLATVGVLGDLGESLFKRSLGVKDSGRRFPGMGGFLDVVDSLLFSAPFLFLYIRWFLK